MRSDLLRALRQLLLPTLAVVTIAAFLPGRLQLATRIYALLLCALALGLCLTALRRAYPPARPLRPRVKRAESRRPPPLTLGRLERETALGIAGTFELHYRLRPHMRELAEGLLASRRRISLDGDPERARVLLGAEAWDLVRRDRTPPEDRLAHGIPPSELARAVESLEHI